MMTYNTRRSQFSQTIPTMLKDWRLLRGLTQIQMAKFLDSSPANYRRWETGKLAMPMYVIDMMLSEMSATRECECPFCHGSGKVTTYIR